MANFFQNLTRLQLEKKSFLCVGLDPDAARLPECLRGEKNPAYRFCREIIEATSAQAVAFKLNFAFFESQGIQGWETLEMLQQDIPAGCLSIADAKRGDIGNTASHYADAILGYLNFDAVTVNPYLGHDAALPFLEYRHKGIYFLCLTSNPGASDLQFFPSAENPLFLHVARLVRAWNRYGNCGLVVGATKLEHLRQVRDACPELNLLAPGVGAQGATLSEAVRALGDTNLLLPISRAILYASAGSDFAEAAALAAEKYRAEMQQFL